MYNLLIGVNVVLGFLMTLYQSLIGPHKFDLLNGANEEEDKNKILEYYGKKQWVMYAAVLAGEVWTRVSHALVLVSFMALLCVSAPF